MKRRTKSEKRPRPKLPRIPQELRQWADLMLCEILAWKHSPNPSWQEIDNWLHTHNIASNIPGWCDHIKGLTSAQS
jgi:hypothetical protein